MADKFDKGTRSRIMSKIRATETKPEITVRKYLFSKGFRYRKNQKGLPGKPDIVLKKHRSVVFVNGCFWHGHTGCKKFVMPKTRTDFWTNKIEKNRKRDDRNAEALRSLGWKVNVVWECKLSSEADATLDSLKDRILSA